MNKTSFTSLSLDSLTGVTGGYHDPAPSTPSTPPCNPPAPEPVRDRGLGDIFRRLVQGSGIGRPLRW